MKLCFNYWVFCNVLSYDFYDMTFCRRITVVSYDKTLSHHLSVEFCMVGMLDTKRRHAFWCLNKDWGS